MGLQVGYNQIMSFVIFNSFYKFLFCPLMYVVTTKKYFKFSSQFYCLVTLSKILILIKFVCIVEISIRARVAHWYTTTFWVKES